MGNSLYNCTKTLFVLASIIGPLFTTYPTIYSLTTRHYSNFLVQTSSILPSQKPQLSFCVEAIEPLLSYRRLVPTSNFVCIVSEFLHLSIYPQSSSRVLLILRYPRIELAINKSFIAPPLLPIFTLTPP